MRIIKTSNYLYTSIICLLIIYCFKIAMGNGDFKVYLGAANLIKNGQSPYDTWIFVSEGNYCFYFYSPLWAILLIPFSILPPYITNLFWLLANVIFLHRIFLNLRSFISPYSYSKKQVNLILILCLLFSLRFILYNFEMIQMTIFLLWGILESLKLIQNQKTISGSLLLAFIINIKILPIVILPYLIYRKLYKGFILSLLFIIILLFLPSLYTGWSNNMNLLHEWWTVINPTNPEHNLETELGPHSLTALIPSLLSETNGELDYSRNILDLTIDNANLVLNALRLLLIALTIYFLKWPPFNYVKSNLMQLRELGYILLLIPLIFPHQQKYAFVLILPAAYYLSHFIIINRAKRNDVLAMFKWQLLIFLVSFSFVLMTLSTDGLIGQELNRITQHYKTITWGVILLIFALLIAKPITKHKNS